MQKNDVFDSLVVVKRSGQRCDFQGEKIAIAIKKAFDSIEHHYESKDINLVYENVLHLIMKRYQNRKTIKIEDIQDLIVEVLNHKGYQDVYVHYQKYRAQRTLTRESFATKEQHKFLKAMEKLGLNDSDDPKLVGSMLPPQVMTYEFGKVISEEFAQSFLLDHKTVRNLDSGLLYLHDLDSYPMGCPVSVQLVFSNRFKEAEKSSIKDALLSLIHLIHRVFDEQSGNVMIPYFEKELEEPLLHNFISIWEHTLELKLSSFGLQEVLPMEELRQKFSAIQSLQIDLEDYRFFYQSSKQMKDLFFDSYRESLESLQRVLKDELCWFLKEMDFQYQQNLKGQKLSLSIGTETTYASMMIDKVLISSFVQEKPKSVRGIFKVKQELHLKQDGMLREVCKKAFEPYYLGVLDFEFLDVVYNQSKEDVCYGVGGERAFYDNTTQDGVFVGNKGGISFTSINLPRIALRHQHDENLKYFYEELSETIEMAVQEILERFEYQCSKHCYNFPVLIESGIWKFGENVKENDRLRKVWKHGVLQLGFVGLWESVFLLLGKKENEKEAQKEAISIVQFMKERLRHYSEANNLNFTLTGVLFPEVGKHFFELDEVIYGKLKPFTKNRQYSSSFHILSKMDFYERMSLEGKFHELCDGGHVFLVYQKPKGDFQEVLFQMIQNGIGYTHYCKMLDK